MPPKKPEVELKPSKPPSSKSPFEKHSLKCPNAKCKYERVVAKAKLTRNDFECPKCGTLMKEHKQRAGRKETDEPEDIEANQ